MNRTSFDRMSVSGVQLSLDDLLDGARCNYRASLRRPRVAVFAVTIGAAAASFGAFVVPAQGWSVGWGVAFGVGALAYFCALMGLIYLLALPRTVRRQWRENKLLHETLEVSWSAEGYRAQGRNVHSDMPWSYYRCWRETGSLFLLYYSSLQYQLLPKRYLTREQLAGFRQTLAETGVPRNRPRN